MRLKTPRGEEKLLLHSCCAPCAADIMDTLIASDIAFTVYFYNPNIHPHAEYLLRKDENVRFAQKRGIPFIDADYDKENWFDRVKGLEMEPERGKRCDVCFDVRFERSALYAHENGFSLFSSTLGISRWKDMEQINRAGIRAASRYPNMAYWTFNWRKGGGSARMIETAKDENFYQQEYCGCVYSLRDTNQWRMQSGRAPVQRGIRFYGEEPKGAPETTCENMKSHDLPVIF